MADYIAKQDNDKTARQYMDAAGYNPLQELIDLGVSLRYQSDDNIQAQALRYRVNDSLLRYYMSPHTSASYSDEKVPTGIMQEISGRIYRLLNGTLRKQEMNEDPEQKLLTLAAEASE